MGLKDDLQEAKEDLKKILLILTGNGHPEEGLVFKVAQHDDFISFWKKFGWAVIVAGLTIPPGVVTLVILNIFHIK